MRNRDRPPRSPRDELICQIPAFSIVITTYNRARIVCRCIDSCLAQTFERLRDRRRRRRLQRRHRAALAERYDDPRLRVVAHESNRGINPSRHTGASNARGEWVVVVDSDDELLPGALERLHELIAELPEGVRVLRSRQLHDDGHVTPSFVPDGPYGYEGRIRWAEAEGGNDAARCLQRAVFAETPYIDGRRGAMETLFELNLAERETSALRRGRARPRSTPTPPTAGCAPPSAADVIPRLQREAPDMLWMAETTLERHGEALRRYGPRPVRDRPAHRRHPVLHARQAPPRRPLLAARPCAASRSLQQPGSPSSSACSAPRGRPRRGRLPPPHRLTDPCAAHHTRRTATQRRPPRRAPGAAASPAGPAASAVWLAVQT